MASRYLDMELWRHSEKQRRSNGLCTRTCVYFRLDRNRLLHRWLSEWFSFPVHLFVAHWYWVFRFFRGKCAEIPHYQSFGNNLQHNLDRIPKMLISSRTIPSVFPKCNIFILFMSFNWNRNKIQIQSQSHIPVCRMNKRIHPYKHYHCRMELEYFSSVRSTLPWFIWIED